MLYWNVFFWDSLNSFLLAPTTWQAAKVPISNSSLCSSHSCNGTVLCCNFFHYLLANKKKYWHSGLEHATFCILSRCWNDYTIFHEYIFDIWIKYLIYKQSFQLPLSNCYCVNLLETKEVYSMNSNNRNNIMNAWLYKMQTSANNFRI